MVSFPLCALCHDEGCGTCIDGIFEAVQLRGLRWAATMRVEQLHSGTWVAEDPADPLFLWGVGPTKGEALAELARVLAKVNAREEVRA